MGSENSGEENNDNEEYRDSNRNQNISPLMKQESPVSLIPNKSEENRRKSSKSPFLKLQKEESKRKSFQHTKKLEIFPNNLLFEKEENNFEISPLLSSKIFISRDPAKSFNVLDKFLRLDFKSFVIFSQVPSHSPTHCENLKSNLQKNKQKTKTCESLNEIEKSDEKDHTTNNEADLKKITFASIGEFHHRHLKRKITKEIRDTGLDFDKMKCFSGYFVHNNVENVLNSLLIPQYSNEKINVRKKKKFLMKTIHKSNKIQPLHIKGSGK